MTPVPDTAAEPRPPAPEPAPFARILCGVNAARPSQEAVRQALILADGGAHVHLLAIADAVGVGPTRTALLSPHRADLALDEARHAARDAGVDATVERLDDPNPVGRLLEAAQHHDLLAIGSPIRSRAQGMLLGETAGVALHRATVPLLLARAPDADAPFPARILVATDATPWCRDAVRTGARLARRHDAPLTLLHVADAPSPEERHELAEQATTAQEITGREPIVLSERGRPVARIVEVAASHDGTLVVTGSGGRRGLGALGSVSERVGARAGCSVLVLRPSVQR